MSSFYTAFIKRSQSFAERAARFPTKANLVEAIFKESDSDQFEETFAKSAYPYMHKKVIVAAAKFLSHKKEHGSEAERKLYKAMNLKGFLDRFVTKRPLVFFNGCDTYVLRNGDQGMGWDPENFPGGLSEYMTYDEIKLAALMQAGCNSVFINSGGRYNSGRKDTSENFITQGVILGAVGARFEVPGKMEWEECLVSEHNTAANGYGKGETPEHRYRQIWAELYDCEQLPLKEDAVIGQGFVKVYGGNKLNIDVYEKRMIILAELLFFEANSRAQREGKKAYVHVVGFGLGVWQVSEDQTAIFRNAFLGVLSKYEFKHIGVVDFAWIRDLTLDKSLPNNPNIVLKVSQRDPGAPLENEYKDHLLIASYAWDGNSFPGNEYWKGASYLTASGDPAAAAYSLLPELVNHEINTDYYSIDSLRIIDPASESVISGNEAENVLTELEKQYGIQA